MKAIALVITVQGTDLKTTVNDGIAIHVGYWNNWRTLLKWMAHYKVVACRVRVGEPATHWTDDGRTWHYLRG